MMEALVALEPAHTQEHDPIVRETGGAAHSPAVGLHGERVTSSDINPVGHEPESRSFDSEVSCNDGLESTIGGDHSICFSRTRANHAPERLIREPLEALPAVRSV